MELLPNDLPSHFAATLTCWDTHWCRKGKYQNSLRLQTCHQEAYLQPLLQGTSPDHVHKIPGTACCCPRPLLALPFDSRGLYSFQKLQRSLSFPYLSACWPIPLPGNSCSERSTFPRSCWRAWWSQQMPREHKQKVKTRCTCRSSLHLLPWNLKLPKLHKQAIGKQPGMPVLYCPGKPIRTPKITGTIELSCLHGPWFTFSLVEIVYLQEFWIHTDSSSISSFTSIQLTFIEVTLKHSFFLHHKQPSSSCNWSCQVFWWSDLGIIDDRRVAWENIWAVKLLCLFFASAAFEFTSVGWCKDFTTLQGGTEKPGTTGLVKGNIDHVDSGINAGSIDALLGRRRCNCDQRLWHHGRFRRGIRASHGVLGSVWN